MTDHYLDEAPLRITGINWTTSLFLLISQLITLIATPIYIWRFGVGSLEVGLFLSLFLLTGLSITVGYHRLFTHRAYTARWPVRLAAVLFGAAAFEMSALRWSSEHRNHHKYTDQDGDPHDPHSIRRGFLWAHVGWLMFRVDPAMRYDNVADLRRDPIVVWQDRNYVAIAIAMGFFLPMAVGGLLGTIYGPSLGVGVLAGFVFGACARIAVVHHLTFFINSLAHTVGRKPYDGNSSSRDSGLLAFLTFGEGYHNFHHAFQTDYRNGIRAWHFDPAKWIIWTLSKVGLATRLRRIPEETIRMARLREKRRRLNERLAGARCDLHDALESWMDELEAKLQELHLRFRVLLAERDKLRRQRGPRLQSVKRELQQLRRDFRCHWKAWILADRQARALS